MTAPKYDEGKVYLQDTRNGTIYPYERWLALDKSFKAIVPNQVKSAPTEPQHQEQVTVNSDEHPAPTPG